MVRFMVKKQCKNRYDINNLLAIMAKLRGPGGCPWDAEQTHATIRRNLIEEASEAAEAIDLQDSALLCEELGDVLLQVVFHSVMAADAGEFTMEDVISGICQKLIDRHPHVFGDVKVENSAEVLNNWDEIKRTTKGHTTARESLEAVSKGLPGLMRLQKLLSKSQKAGLPRPEAMGFEAQLLQLAQQANAQGVDLETEAAAACRKILANAD